MNVQIVTRPQSQVSLDIAVDSQEVDSAIDRAYRRLAERYNVPGFRKGKAPRPVLEAAVGRSTLMREAGDIAVNDAYQRALDQTGLQPITSPEVSMQSEGLDPSQPLYFTATFYVRPEVTLGDYRSIRVPRAETPVTDEDVEQAITKLAEREAPWEPVEDRPAADGDLATIKLTGTVDGETVVDGSSEEEYLLEPGSGALDLTPHLRGLSAGESRDFELALPESYEPAEYAGKTMQCHVELVRLEHKAAPIVDDAFAQSIGEYETLDELRARVRATLERDQKARDAEEFVAAVMRHALDEAAVQIPPPLVEDEIHSTFDELRASVESRRELSFDLYLRVLGKTMEDLHEEARGPAEERVKSNLVLEAIAEAEGIAAPREEVEAELRVLAALPTVRERDRRRVLGSPAVRARIEARLKRRLALQRLLEIANPNQTDDSADTDTDTDKGTITGDRQALHEAARSHADALEGSAPDPVAEEV